MGDLLLHYIEPLTPAFDEAKELRFTTLYDVLGLPRELIEDRGRRQYLHLAAYDDGRLVGYARLHLQDGESKVYQVCVDRAERRRGIGTALMAELERVAAGVGRERLVLDAREEAVAFYQRLGYLVVGDTFISERTGTPHRRMAKDLTSTAENGAPTA